MDILVLTDNLYLYENFKKEIKQKKYNKYKFHFYFSYNNEKFLSRYRDADFFPINVKKKKDYIINYFDLVFSLHCKQIFPKEIVNNVRSINVHPGYNPYNRGWFPQVFSIINSLPAGVTIHEMNAEVDAGPIIIQKTIDIEEYETSFDLYQRILSLELELLKEKLLDLIDEKYEKQLMTDMGNYNGINDFKELCEIDLNEKTTYKDAINFFRAMTFDNYENAYFYDKNGEKIFVEIVLKRSSKEEKK